MSNISRAHIAILMTTYQGEAFLREQLDSFFAQSYQNWTLWVSDDGSSDQTLPILLDYQRRWGEERLRLLTGPKRGFVANFLSMVCNPDIQADYFAFSDQDDRWNADKLERALIALGAEPNGRPTLYCSRTHLVDAQGLDLGLSPLFSCPPSFKNALVQSIGGGNTMMFNQRTRELLIRGGMDVPVVSHDWWTYIVVTGAGGRVIYDPNPCLDYRQHGKNLIGSNMGFWARLDRGLLLFKGRFRTWSDANQIALEKIIDQLTPENKIVFNTFTQARHASFFTRLLKIKQSGVYRQSRIDNIAFFFAAVFNCL